MSWNRLIFDLIEKYPRMGRETYLGNSRKQAIKLFCRECLGGSNPGECTSQVCALWRYRTDKTCDPYWPRDIYPIPDETAIKHSQKKNKRS